MPRARSREVRDIGRSMGSGRYRVNGPSVLLSRSHSFTFVKTYDPIGSPYTAVTILDS